MAKTKPGIWQIGAATIALLALGIATFLLLKKPDTLPPPKTTPPSTVTAKSHASYAEALNQKTQYTPKPEDLSPEGFNWVHRDFALILSPCLLAHNLNGIVNKTCLQSKKQMLTDYEKSLYTLTEKQLAAWTREHRLSFFINAYHARLLHSLIGETTDIKLFGKTQTLKEFRKEKIWNSLPEDKRLYFITHCSEKGCPPIQNRIINWRGFEKHLESAVVWYLNHTERFSVDQDKKTLKVAQYLKPFWKSLGSAGETSEQWISRYLQKPEDKKLLEKKAKWQIEWIEGSDPTYEN